MYRPVLALVIIAVVIPSVTMQYPVNVVELCKSISNRLGSHFVRHPNNCNSMYNCDGDLSFPNLMNCGAGLVFSQSQQVCVYKDSEFDDCEKDIYSGKYNDPLCRPQPNGLNRDPSSCNRFIPCWGGNSYPSMKCQGVLEFSVETQRCEEPGKARCNLRG